MNNVERITYHLSYSIHKPGTAIFSSDKLYRYVLTRTWNLNGNRFANFMLCNPSIATENILDPTVRKCAEWSIIWGYDGLIITNIFAYRSTDVKQIYKVPDPVGVENDFYIKQVWDKCKDGIIIAGCGTNGKYLNRWSNIFDMAMVNKIQLNCLKTTKYGYPEHPLYLPKSTTPMAFGV